MVVISYNMGLFLFAGSEAISLYMSLIQFAGNATISFFKSASTLPGPKQDGLPYLLGKFIDEIRTRDERPANVIEGLKKARRIEECRNTGRIFRIIHWPTPKKGIHLIRNFLSSMHTPGKLFPRA